MSALFTYPQEIKKKELEDFILITDHNHKDMVITGRSLFVIDRALMKVMGSFCVYPCLRPRQTLVIRGDCSVPTKNHYVFGFDGQNHDEWRESYGGIISFFKKAKMLYVNKKLKPATFEWR